MTVHVLTDKAKTKQLPCTYPGCLDEVIVNVFYAPAKARCPEHSGKTAPSIRLAVSSNGDDPVTPNFNVGELRCPICSEPMEIIRVDEEMAWPTLRCPSPCSTAIEIKPRWAPVIMNMIDRVPEPMRDLLLALNVEQHCKRKHDG